jgi:hypothetical protein
MLILWAMSALAHEHPLWELAKRLGLPIGAAYLFTLLAGLYFGLRTYEGRSRGGDR